MASQVTHPSKAYRESWMVVTPTYSGGSDACCNYDYSCPEADRGVGCVPDARAFHQMNPGFFTGGRLSMIVYGGLDRTGRSLGDLWRSLGGLWEVPGKILKGDGTPGGIWEVLGSKSGATLSEKAKKIPRAPTLPCVYEGQNHFMLQITI